MKVTELIKKTFIYKIYHSHMLKQEEKHKANRVLWFKEEGEEILSKFSEALNSNGIVFWLEFGTLLGYYREHGFIKHDCDLDFGVHLDKSADVKIALEKAGFKLVHAFKSSDGGLEECYKYKHTTLDVFYFREDERGLYCNSFSPVLYTLKEKLSKKRKCLVERVYIPNNGFSTVEFKGCNVGIPNNVVEHLEMHYGKSFMIPNPQFNYRKEAQNIIFHDISEVYGYSFIYGKK